VKARVLAPVPSLTRIAFYVRVSSEEQTDRETAKNQIDYLQRRYAADLTDDSPNPMQLVGLFVDDGYSGTLRLNERPDGRRLLELAQLHEVDAVIMYRLDRLGRSARVLLEAHDELDRCGVAIVSATEPFDTRTHIGRFVFQLLGSIAELERETIRERMTLGRDRRARDDKFLNGPVPYGFAVGSTGGLVPSDKFIDALGMTEADIARQIFQRVADGDSTRQVARWLTARDVPSTTRYRSNKTGLERESVNKHWGAWRIQRMINSPMYRGQRELNHAAGTIEQHVTALVDDLLWQRATKQLAQNAEHPMNTALYSYLLRGRLECGLCGGSVVGNYQKKTGRLYYACLRAKGRSDADPANPCRLGYIRGEPIEDLVLREVDEFIAQPDIWLDALRAQLRERQGISVDRDAEYRRLNARLRATRDAKQDILDLIRQRAISRDEAATQLAHIDDDAALVRHDMDALDSQSALSEALEAQLVDSARLLREIGTYWAEWRAAKDQARLQGVVQQLVIKVRLYPKAEPYREYTFAGSQSEAQSHDHAAQIDLLRLRRGAA
jgi:site-specific DNA recombinase